VFRDTSHKLTESTAERVIESSIRESTTSQPEVTRPESSQSSKPTDDDDASQSLITSPPTHHDFMHSDASSNRVGLKMILNPST
jgi:hypothetical protein